MRLRIKQTKSQQQLAAQLGLAPERKSGFFSRERKRLLIHAAKTTLAATFSWWIAKSLGLRDGYWGSISSIIVLQSNVGATVTASRNRLLGTMIGAAFGFFFSLFGPPLLGYVLALLLSVLVCGLLGLRNSARLAGVTVTIILLVHKAGSRWGLAMDRVLEVALGVVVALAVASLIFPDRARIHLRDGLAREFLVLGALFEAILEGFRGAPAEKLADLEANAEALVTSNNALLDAARNEPSQGPGWREGLGLLSQSCRSLLDALLALALAVRDSNNDRFAARLEPELGKLADNTYIVFHYMADCIHDWRFSEPPSGLDVERDIAALEARMDEVRHTGIEFSQTEILRAYSVQLHLKQIGQLLRDARVGAERAVSQTGE